MTAATAVALSACSSVNEGPSAFSTQYQTAINAIDQGNYREGLAALKKLAAEGDANAQYDLGVIYRDGLYGESVNVAKAADLFKKSADQGVAPAAHDLAQLQPTAQAVQVVVPETVVISAEDQLAAYAEAMEHFERGNYPAAVSLFERLAQLGFADAQHDLGLIYRDGLTGQTDLAKARYYLTQAAKQGHAQAIADLAQLSQ